MAEDDVEEEIAPDFIEDIEDIDDPEEDTPQAETPEVDLTAGTFPEVTKRFEAEPHNFFADPNYYKTALSNEDDIAKRLHGLLQKYFHATDPKDRSVFRPQIISAYWEFLRSVARKVTGK
jgi:hypothetical protein